MNSTWWNSTAVVSGSVTLQNTRLCTGLDGVKTSSYNDTREIATIAKTTIGLTKLLRSAR